jgi:hypothetical protein
VLIDYDARRYQPSQLHDGRRNRFKDEVDRIAVALGTGKQKKYALAQQRQQGNFIDGFEYYNKLIHVG